MAWQPAENLGLHRAGQIHQVNAAAFGNGWCGGFGRGGFFAGPIAENSFGGFLHGGGIEITDQNQHGVFRRVEIAIDRLQLFASVRGDLFFGGRNLRVGMAAEENFAQAFAGEKTGLGAFQFYFFELLAAFAFKFGGGERGFASQFVDQLQQRFCLIAQSGKGNRAVVLTRARQKDRRQVRADVLRFRGWRARAVPVRTMVAAISASAVARRDAAEAFPERK